MFVVNESNFFIRVRCTVVNQVFFFFFLIHRAPDSMLPSTSSVLAMCSPTGGLWAEPNLNKNMAIHSPLM